MEKNLNIISNKVVRENYLERPTKIVLEATV